MSAKKSVVARLVTEHVSERDAAARVDLTADAGAAQAFARLHNGYLLFDWALGAWLEFDGVRWARDELGRVNQRGLEVSRELLTDAAQAMLKAARTRDPDLQKMQRADADKAAKAALDLHKKPRLDAMISLAASDPRCAATRAQFDVSDMLLGVANGVVELSELPVAHREGAPSDMVTRQAGCGYDSLALCPTWDAFLLRVQPDAAARQWLRRLVGYWLTGRTTEQSFVVLHGLGANGKSVFAET
ncbi:protein containing Phage/plasmid primase, P4, partial [mine drainage metagenome]